MDLIAVHNQHFPSNKVSLADLKPNSHPDFQCKVTELLKNGFLTCGCNVRAEGVFFTIFPYTCFQCITLFCNVLHIFAMYYTLLDNLNISVL